MFALPALAAIGGGSTAAGLGTIGMVGSAVTGGMQAYGQYKAGKAADQAARHNAQVMENEKQLALSNAKISMQRERYNANRAFSAARARAGSSGVVMSGSQLDSFEELATNQEISLLDAAYNATQYAKQNEAQQAMTRYQGKVARRSGKYSAFGTLMSTGASVGNQLYSGVNKYNSGIFKESLYTPSLNS